MSLPDRLVEAYWPPSGSERDFWSHATYIQRVWAMKCQHVFLVLFGLTFVYGLDASTAMLYGGAVGFLSQAAIVAYYEALSREYRKEDRDADEETQAAEQENVEAKKAAARKTLLRDESTHTGRTLKKWITVEYRHPSRSGTAQEIECSAPSRPQVDYERFGIKSYSLPPAVIDALRRNGPSMLGGSSAVPVVDGDSLTTEQKRVIDRYFGTCLRIEDFIAAGVSPEAKADAYMRIDELAAATAIELQMLGGLQRDKADMDLRNWIAGIKWYE